MSKDVISLTCLSSFIAELDELRQNRSLFVAAKEVLMRYSYVLKKDANSMHWFAENVVNKKINLSVIREDTVNKSILLLAWGSFEQFMRNLVRESAEKRNSIGWANNIIPEKVKNHHGRICADVISMDIRGELSHLSISRSKVATDLRNLICEDGDLNLNPDALAAFGGKFREDELQRLGERVGIDLSWTKLGESAELKKKSGKSSSEAAGKWAGKLFCDVRDARNIHAHMGVGVTTLEWILVDGYISFLEALAIALEGTVRRSLVLK